MQVTVVLGSASDKPVADKCAEILRELGIPYKIRVSSAHRTPERVAEIARDPSSDVFIAIAGLSAALPGVIASHTTKPVIGVPVNAKVGGLDALLSIAQMPPGIPVASVGIDRGENAALLAAQILALKDNSLNEKLLAYRKKLREKVEKDDSEAAEW